MSNLINFLKNTIKYFMFCRINGIRSQVNSEFFWFLPGYIGFLINKFSLNPNRIIYNISGL